MPTHNLDEDQGLYGPLEFVIDGKKFTVKKLSERVLKEMGDYEKVSDQLAFLANVDPKETEDLDLRKVLKAIQLIMESVTDSFGDFGKKFFKIEKKNPKEMTVKNRRRLGGKGSHK